MVLYLVGTKKSMKYPSWADPFIVKSADKCSLAEKLIKGDDSRILWERLRKHENFLNGCKDSSISAEYAYYFDIKNIVKDIANLPNASPGQIKKRAGRVSELARELAQELEYQFETLGSAGKVPEVLGLGGGDSPFLQDKVSVFERENSGIVSRIVLGGFDPCSIMESPFGVVRESKEILHAHSLCKHLAKVPLVENWKRRWGITNEQWEDEAYVPIEEADADFPTDVHLAMGKKQVRAKIIVNATDLTVVKVLHQLAKELDEYNDGVFLVNKPSIEGVAVKAFMREVYEYHVLRFGQPLKEEIAMLITIVFGVYLTKDCIKM